MSSTMLPMFKPHQLPLAGFITPENPVCTPVCVYFSAFSKHQFLVIIHQAKAAKKPRRNQTAVAWPPGNVI
jgi:hypothetical protein